MNDDKKVKEHEYEVFLGFIETASLPIVIDSIEQPNPPKPDILCESNDGEPLAFELTRVLDQDVARRRKIMFEGLGRHSEILSKLPETAPIFHQFGDAIFSITFRDDSSQMQRDNASYALIERLNRGELVEEIARREYVMLPPADKALRPLERVHIRRGVNGGPLFNAWGGGAFGIPVEDSIVKKFNKNYETDRPIDLLVYIHTQPLVTEEIWLPAVEEFAQTEFPDSQFNRLWLYDHRHRRIIYQKGAD